MLKFLQLIHHFTLSLIKQNKANSQKIFTMEFKLRKESQSLLEKIFYNHERRGVVRSFQMPTLLRSINPELNYTEIELKELVSEEDKDGNGLDFDAFSRISLHFLLKQSRRESDAFTSKNLVRLADFTEV